jgi:surface antigen
MRSNLIIVALGASLLASSCGPPSTTGAVVGAGAGGVVGGLSGGTGGMLFGAAVGGILGYAGGRAVEEEDRRRAAIALEQNRQMEWVNQEGVEYRVVPTQTRYYSGRECRDFRMFAEIDGRPEQVNGTACRRPDGSWETLSG